jgi:hypothetical protein
MPLGGERNGGAGPFCGFIENRFQHTSVYKARRNARIHKWRKLRLASLDLNQWENRLVKEV